MSQGNVGEPKGEAGWYDSDAPLRALLERELPAHERDRAPAWLGQVAAAAMERVSPLSALADRHGPRLQTHDRFGRRIDEIEYHPSYVEMQRIAYGELGLVAMKYGAERSSHTLAFAAAYLFSQAESGLFCPVCMTDGAARVLEKFAAPALRDRLLPRLCARELGKLATGAMFLTEKAGGSDVGRTETVARPEGEGGAWRLHGEKWFCSNVDAGVILALARPEGAPAGTRGLGLFVVEPRLADGTRNRMVIQRLKDKLGVRSMPTGEVSFEGAHAELVGEPEQGFRYMTEMMNLSRLYNAVASVAAMRRALHEGCAWVESRVVFGRPAAAQPLCMETLGDLAAESAGALAFVFAAVRALDDLDTRKDERARKRLRILTPLAKYHTAKRAVWAASEGMELCGGNGYIEDFPTPRLLRDAQVLPIWEGTTNICVLDAMRAMAREDAGQVLLEDIAQLLEGVRQPALAPLLEVARRQRRLVEELAGELIAKSGADEAQAQARRLCDRLVALFQVALALGQAERLGDAGGRDALVAERLIERHLEAPRWPRVLDGARLGVLLGDRTASIAEALAR